MTHYVGIRSEGGLIPYDILDKIAKEESGFGQQPKDFGLPAGRRVTDEIARAWSDAQDYWHIFQRRTASLPESETGTTITRKWVADLLNELLGYEPTYQPSGAVIGGKNYPISHRAGSGEESPPVQIEGFRIDLDRRPEGRRLSPQALVQEYLNNSDSHLWGIVTNGFLLRLLRDTSRTSRPSYLEFDLQSILDGNRFNEFALFYRVCHRTRLPRTAEDSTSCWLEKYFQLSIEQGGRVRDKLRDGVEDALKLLGTGFLRHPQNVTLSDRIKDNTLTAAEFHRQLLRLVYRLLFLMVAEERRMIVPEAPDSERRQRLYDSYYSVGRLRALAEKAIEPSGFGDLWIGLQQSFVLFEEGDSNPLGIPPLNGQLFSAVEMKDLLGTHLFNNDLLAAMERLSLFEDLRVRQRVNYGALDVEELGSVYESLLDYQPVFTERPEGMSFELRTGSDRKSTGSYYTRPELVRELIESALVPVMQDRLAAAKDSDPVKDEQKKQQAILSMSVCDPACGSGHFLLAAARRLGRELAKVRTGEEEPTPKEFHLAVRDVIAYCIYGVDVNPLAVDLCKLALWLEGHWTGKPLSFLDNRVKCGNSLIGVLDIRALKEGIPDDAFNPVTGDNKEIARAFKRRNREERQGQPSLQFDAEEHVHQFAVQSEDFVAITEDTPADVRRKKEAYEKARQRPDWWHDWVAANIWTAAFFIPLTKYDDQTVPTQDKFMAYARGGHVDAHMEPAVMDLAVRLNFFHWQLEFPEVFERGGFDLALGNPPWEKIKLQEVEFFGTRNAEIATAPNKAVRDMRIKALFRPDAPSSDRLLAQEFVRAKRLAEGESKYIRLSARYPLTGVGDINSYAPFAETFVGLIKNKGRAGVVIPSGLATDHTTRRFFGYLVDKCMMPSFYEFENEGFFSAGQGHMIRFALATLAKADSPSTTDFVFQAKATHDLRVPERHFTLSVSDISLLNPNTLTCPIFLTKTDATLTKKIYSTVPVFIREDETTPVNLWGVEFLTMFHMANDSALFRTSAELRQLGAKVSGADWVTPDGDTYVRLYEAKMMYMYNHRHGDFAFAADGERVHRLPPTPLTKLQDHAYLVRSYYWVQKTEVENRLSAKHWHSDWLLAWRNVTDARASERTVIFSVLPREGAAHSLQLLLPRSSTPQLQACLLANFNSLVLDYVARQKLGGINLTLFVVMQLPILPSHSYKGEDQSYIASRVGKLVCTAEDVRSFGTATDAVKLVVWDEADRANIRAELDAYFAHLYGLTRLELQYILNPEDVVGPNFPGETFRVLKDREEKEYGEYRTRRLVLKAFDRLAGSPRFRDEMPKRKSVLDYPKKLAQSVAD